MKTLLLFLAILIYSNGVKADDQIAKPFDQWSGLYLVRNVNNSIHVYCIKDPKMDVKNEKAFRDGIVKWAKKKNKSWIYGIKLQEDLIFKESRSIPITEQEAANMVKLFRVFEAVIPE